MERVIELWLRVGLLVYWLGWLGCMAIWNTSTWVGIGIGVIGYIIWFIILNILSLINGSGWVWNWDNN